MKRFSIENKPKLPSKDRIKKGPVAYIECFQKIPCNPCEKACPHDAITVGIPITNLPKIDQEKCVGCGICIASCPGLAIFVLGQYENKGRVSLPYEYLPLPQKGDNVKCVTKDGEIITKGKVVRIIKTKKYDSTAVVTVEIPKKYIYKVKSIKA